MDKVVTKQPYVYPEAERVEMNSWQMICASNGGSTQSYEEDTNPFIW